MVRRYDYRYNPFNLDNMDRQKESIHSMPFWIGLLVIFVLCGIFGTVFLIDMILPSPLKISNEASYADSFIAERAEKDLKFLTDLGPRVTGSYENEYQTVEFLTIQIKRIISEAAISQYIEYDIQTVTGGYYLDNAAGYMNVYDRVQNVVVKLHGLNNASEHSILVNCHFDSVPTSPGGSDDGINVVTMLEVLRKLSKAKDRQLQNIIFLFNGAEETPMQAAHGFIAHHKWANESKIVINLEAVGGGGKIFLFQTGPGAPWLAKYYRKVPHPYGNVIGEELFQSGIIPSDTDFRVFRDFGDIIGVDMAFIKNGYRYHTKFDGFSNIPLGSYQHVGDNTLSLVKSYANAPEVLEQHLFGSSYNRYSMEKAVYFDIFGWFMISYGTFESMIINLVAITSSIGMFIFSLLSFRTGMSGATWKYLILTLGAILGSWFLAVGFVFCFAAILDILNKTMSWYAHPWMIFGLYVIPTIGFSGCLLYFTNHRFTYFQNLSLNVRSQIQIHLVRIIYTIVLIVVGFFNVRSMFCLTIPVLFNVLGFLIIHLFGLQHTVRTWQIVFLVVAVPPTSFACYLMSSHIMFFIPLTGRMGVSFNPEFLIGGITLLHTLLIVSPLTVLSNCLRQIKFYYFTLILIFGIFVGLLYTPIAFPYSGNLNCPRPQRHWILHNQRQFYNETGDLIRSDAGFFMLNMDRNSPGILRPYVHELNDSESIDKDCEQHTLCAMPLLHAKTIKKMKSSTWIPSSAPVFPQNETLKFSVISKQNLTPKHIKYTIQVSGPDKLFFYITPYNDVKFLNTSLINTTRPTKYTFQGRPVYVILYQLGKGDGTPLTFNLTVQILEYHQGPTLDIAVSARYVHEKRIERTAAYISFLKQFPEWTDITAWLGAYQSYII